MALALALTLSFFGSAHAGPAPLPSFKLENVDPDVRFDEFGCFADLVDLHAKYPAAVDIATHLYRKNACDTLYMVNQWRKRTSKDNK
jgi:hypothetical protein